MARHFSTIKTNFFIFANLYTTETCPPLRPFHSQDVPHQLLPQSPPAPPGRRGHIGFVRVTSKLTQLARLPEVRHFRKSMPNSCAGANPLTVNSADFSQLPSTPLPFCTANFSGWARRRYRSCANRFTARCSAARRFPFSADRKQTQIN